MARATGDAATAEAESETALKVRRLRVTLKAYTSDVLNEAALLITEAAKLTDAIAKGPTALPTKTKRFCVLRSPHVNKKSREHFEIRTHKKIVDIMDPSAQTIDALMQLDMPSFAGRPIAEHELDTQSALRKVALRFK